MVVQRGDETMAVALEPGAYDFVVDTFVSDSGREHAGRYLFVLARIDQPSTPNPRVRP